MDGAMAGSHHHSLTGIVPENARYRHTVEGKDDMPGRWFLAFRVQDLILYHL